MPARLRFAPSPTGLIHVGNLRTALFNWLVALQESGDFLLRFDDTDAERSRSSFAEAIVEDLAWVGIGPAEVFHQSTRIDLYDRAAEALRASGRLYACFETAEELELKRQRLRRRGLPPIYDRAALKLTDADRSELIASGRRAHWRFLLTQKEGGPAEIVWQDRLRGHQSIDLGSLSDPVLIREDGTYLYTLPSVVDDIDKGITHLIRGEDHVTNTAVQIEIFRALEADPPAFGHHNLLTTGSGEGLSKRTGAQSVGSLREDGYEPMAVATLAALIGTSSAVEPKLTMSALAAAFDLEKVSRAPARFKMDELDSLNAKQLRETPFSMVADRLAHLGVDGDEPFWRAIRGNCAKLQDAALWWRIMTGLVDAPGLAADQDFLTTAARLLPAEPWDDTTFGQWVGALKAETDRKGRSLFLPLRLALTGVDHGPELAILLPLIGRNSTLARLNASHQR